MKYVMLGVVVFALVLTGCSDRDGSSNKWTGTKPIAVDIPAGKAIAERECKGCHGLDGRGGAPGIPHLAAQRDRYLVQSLKEYNDGKRTHAALKDMTGHMSEADLHNVSAYYASLPAIKPSARTAAQAISPYDRGKAHAKACAKCHGEDGNSKTAGTPSLAGQQPRYLVTAIQEYHRGDRDGLMKSILRGASKMELESLALYFASQTPAPRPAPSFGDPAAGEPLSAMCGGCHGSHGVSTDTATPTLAAQDGRYLVNAIKGYRKERHHDLMQRQVDTLSDRDVENIAAFYVTQKSKAAEKGQTIVQDLAEKCNRCHENHVDNPTVAVPKLDGQDREYLVMALRGYRDGRRESSTMHRMSLPFSDAVIESLATLYATATKPAPAGSR